MKNSLETRLGVFFALALIAAVVLMELVGGFDFFKRGVRVRTLFETVQELSEGDPVKIGGYKVGSVEKIQIQEGRLQVTLKIEDAKFVKTDSVASIRFQGLMGQNYVALTFGSETGSPVVDGVTVLRSMEQPDLSAMMARLDNVASGVEKLVSSFSGDSIQNVLGPLTAFIKENTPKLTAMIGNFQTISANIAEGRGSIGRMINDDTLYTGALGAVTNFDRAANDIEGMLGQARTLLNDVQKGQGTLGKLVRDEALYREGTEALANLNAILKKMNQGQGTIGKLINDDTFYRNARLSLQKLDKATESLEDQGPISVLGIVVGKLF
jgi:phospholipid/cholesterol/gamma-HCH transport system substrate-binding protein